MVKFVASQRRSNVQRCASVAPLLRSDGERAWPVGCSFPSRMRTASWRRQMHVTLCVLPFVCLPHFEEHAFRSRIAGSASSGAAQGAEQGLSVSGGGLGTALKIGVCCMTLANSHELLVIQGLRLHQNADSFQPRASDNTSLVSFALKGKHWFLEHTCAQFVSCVVSAGDEYIIVAYIPCWKWVSLSHSRAASSSVTPRPHPLSFAFHSSSSSPLYILFHPLFVFILLLVTFFSFAFGQNKAQRCGGTTHTHWEDGGGLALHHMIRACSFWLRGTYLAGHCSLCCDLSRTMAPSRSARILLMHLGLFGADVTSARNILPARPSRVPCFRLPRSPTRRGLLQKRV